MLSAHFVVPLHKQTRETQLDITYLFLNNYFSYQQLSVSESPVNIGPTVPETQLTRKKVTDTYRPTKSLKNTF